MTQTTSSNIEQGELVVADIMFAEQTGAKRRLALVISSGEFNKNSKDVIVLKVTSKGGSSQQYIRLTNDSTENKALKKDSRIAAGFPVTIAKEKILARPDRITKDKLKEVKRQMAEIYDMDENLFAR